MRVTKGSPFEAAYVRPLSTMNAALTNYRFEITLTNRMLNPAVLVIEPPVEVMLDPDLFGPVCTGIQELQSDQ